MKVVDEEVVFAIARRVADGTVTEAEGRAALERVAIEVPDDPEEDRRTAIFLADLAIDAVRDEWSGR